ncbi:isochorismatase family cysteine hydrolase [Sphingomonas crusticola]|uniref:isochorismatase family cysteine hydrolase n=1 Tax=Sphingomonas crusticola TaxID=1697973 RepID=UPI001F07C8BE|nr:isochorismatase family cysteine hydrolase [Sphingomonas crusticola]
MAKSIMNQGRATAPFRDAPRGNTALIILDMITNMDFAGADAMLRDTVAAAATILKLREAADKARLPVIYVNDNFGEWHSERYRLVERALATEGEGVREFVAKLAPRDGDYFVIKPQFSGFYSTNLPVLLPKLGVDRLVITGIAADICVLFTAADAHMRDYKLWIPEDAVAAETRERRRWALEIMKQSMGAEVRPSDKLTLPRWAKAARKQSPAEN